MNNNEQADRTNPFVQALRDGGNGSAQQEENHSEQNGDAAPNRNEVVAQTMEAMSKGDAPPAQPASNGAVPDGGRMEAVVDLLFGNHLNEINASMRALEKQIAERVNKAEEEMRVRIEALDRHAKGQIETLNQSFESERKIRGDADSKLDERVEGAVKQIDKQLEQMQTNFTSSHEMAQKDLDERLTKATDQTMLLRQAMEQEITNMKVSLSKRSELGGMFVELGKRLEANASGSGL